MISFKKNTIMKIFEIEETFIQDSIKLGIDIAKSEGKYIEDFRKDSMVKRIYFVGQGLCLDIKDDESGDPEVITISWESESFGFFSGGMRRLLSINSLRLLSELMNICEINYEPKVWQHELV